MDVLMGCPGKTYTTTARKSKDLPTDKATEGRIDGGALGLDPREGSFSLVYL